MEFTPEVIQQLKTVSHVWTDGSRKLSLVECLVISASIVSDGVGAADGILYNGESADDERKKDLACASGSMTTWSPKEPVYFSRGLYVEHGSNVKSIDVQFMPLKE